MKLIGKTLKGKNRIRELGEDWNVIRIADSVQFDSTPGPWLMVQPVNADSEKRRWIHCLNDKDFDIVQ